MRKYTQIDGYSATVGYSIAQDDRGYIWIGTDNGGMSFDGNTFRLVQDPQSTPDRDILSCYPLSHDKILLIPLTQPISYLQKGRLITDAQDSQLGKMNNKTHNIAAVDQVTNNYWIWGQRYPKEIFKFSGNDLFRYTIPQVDFDFVNVINSRLVGIRKGTDGMLIPSRFDPERQYYHDFLDEYGKPFNWQQTFFRSVNRHYLVAGGLKPYENKTINIYRYPENGNYLQRVKKIHLKQDNELLRTLIDPNNNLWLNHIGKNGFWYYGNLIAETGNPPCHFPHPAIINSMFVDDQSNLWLTTPNNALYFISKKHIDNAVLNDRFPLKNEIPKMISGDDSGALIISYVNSPQLAYINRKTTILKNLNNLFPEGCRVILRVKNKGFLIMDKGIAFYNIATNSINYLIEDRVNNKDACFYGSEGLLLATNNDVRYIASYLRKEPPREVIFNSRATAVKALSNGLILIGTPNGVYQKTTLQDTAQLIRHPLLAKSNITHIQNLDNENALIGTNAYGLFLYTVNGKVNHLEKERIGSVHYIYREQDTCYWIATNTGAFRLSFSPDWTLKTLKQYTFYDGLPSNSVNSIYVYADTAYIATSEGMGIIPLRDGRAALPPPSPRIYLNTFQVGAYTFDPADSLFTLQPKQKNILISLSAIAYESLGNVSYYYRLYPLQQQWISTRDPNIRFTSLAPGEYQFQAHARNSKGEKSKQNIALNIVVKPAFWQTPIFRWVLPFTIALCFFLLLRKLVIRRQTKRIAQLEQKKQLAALELEAIKAQINPHFIHNCLNSIQYLNYQAEYETAQTYLGLFARLIRMTMNYSQQTFITINKELDYLAHYLQLEKLRFKDQLIYTFDIASNIDQEYLIPAMLIQPYVENALRHGAPPDKPTEILIHFSEDTEQQGRLGLRLSGSRASSYNELFGLNIIIDCYNAVKEASVKQGAVVSIKIKKNYGVFNQSRNNR